MSNIAGELIYLLPAFGLAPSGSTHLAARRPGRPPLQAPAVGSPQESEP